MSLLAPQTTAPTPAPVALQPAAFADAVNSLVRNPERAREMGRRGRERAIAHFGWDVVARQTVDVYLAAGAVPGAVAP